jgi:arginase family enzyme
VSNSITESNKQMHRVVNTQADIIQDVFKTIVIDVDGALLSQHDFMVQSDAKILPVPQTDKYRYWCKPSEFAELVSQVRPLVDDPRIPAIFYGSGDYHHLALVGLSLARQRPTLLIVFDNHTDWWCIPVREYFFGTWVAQAVDENLADHVLMFGVDGDLAMTSHMPYPIGEFTHRLDLVANGRIETYSRTVEKSALLGSFEAESASFDFEPATGYTTVKWQPFHDRAGLLELIERRLTALPLGPVYISVDKDVLAADENFSAYGGMTGSTTLDELTGAIEAICSTRELIGIDVCGDGSKTRQFASLTKRAMSAVRASDYEEADYSSPEHAVQNSNVNIAILEAAARGITTRALRHINAG